MPINDGTGSPVAIAQIVSDLTGRKKAEEETLRARSKHVTTYDSERKTRGTGKPGDRESEITAPTTSAVMQPANGRGKMAEPRTSAILIGGSPLMKKLFATVERVAPTDSSVLITGATELVKSWSPGHSGRSQRASGPFVDLNCSAIPETLIEAELFGHQRGSFTGAHEDRAGLFEGSFRRHAFSRRSRRFAAGSSAKPLRVLQEKSIRRVGGRKNIAVDVRIISATNCDLSNAISEGRFRADLFYRLRVFPILVPDLYQREGDV